MPCIVEQRTGADLNAGVHITEAVRRGDIEAVRAFLKANGNVNVSSRRTGRTLLHIACRQVIATFASRVKGRTAECRYRFVCVPTVCMYQPRGFSVNKDGSRREGKLRTSTFIYEGVLYYS